MNRNGDINGAIRIAIEEAEKAIVGEEPSWHEALAFFGNDQWVEQNALTGQLDRLEVREGGSKQRWQARLTRNRMTAKVMGEVSMLTSRVPDYDLDPASGDPAADNQAQEGEVVLRALHEQLEMENVAIKTLIYAILTGAGFTYPFWNPRLGETVSEDENGPLREGDIDIGILHQGEVLWDPDCTFEESQYVIIRKAKSLERIKQMAEINVENITADAQSGLWERPGSERSKLGFVYDYMRKPGKEAGIWLTIHNGHNIKNPRPFPRKNGEFPLHKMAWVPRPDKHRDVGAGPMLVDCQRGYNRTHNQITDWKNHILTPQLMAPEGSLQVDLTNEPGAEITYRVIGGQKPEWRITPDIPISLFQSLDRALDDMDDILGSHDLPPGVESGSAIQEVNERDQGRRGMVIRQLARWYASNGEHFLEIAQARYRERRLIEAQGMFGVDTIPDFLGRRLSGLGAPRVSPASIQPRTREYAEATVRQYAELGWIQPHEAMKAIKSGNMDIVINDIELDEAKQQREIRRMVTLQMRVEPSVVDSPSEVAAEDQLALEEAGTLEADPAEFPMPALGDGHAVHRALLNRWMKTRDFERQHPMVQEWARDHEEAHRMYEDLEMEAEMARQAQKAEQLGNANAARQPSMGRPSRPAGEPA